MNCHNARGMSGCDVCGCMCVCVRAHVHICVVHVRVTNDSRYRRLAYRVVVTVVVSYPLTCDTHIHIRHMMIIITMLPTQQPYYSYNVFLLTGRTAYERLYPCNWEYYVFYEFLLQITYLKCMTAACYSFYIYFSFFLILFFVCVCVPVTLRMAVLLGVVVRCTMFLFGWK